MIFQKILQPPYAQRLAMAYRFVANPERGLDGPTFCLSERPTEGWPIAIAKPPSSSRERVRVADRRTVFIESGRTTHH